MLAYLAEQESQNQQSFLELIGAPQGAIDQYNQASQFPADVLYGAYGAIPGTALSQQGAAFGQAADNLGGIFQGQLAQNASQQQAEMANARTMAALSSSSGGGGSDGGLTPYQAASLEMRAMEFASDQERYGRQDELDWMKFQADLEQEEADRKERESQAAADSLLYMAVLNPELLSDKKFQKQLARALGMGSASAAGALTGAVTGGREDAANAAADQQTRIQNRREDMWGMLSFSGINDGLSKNQVTQKILADIRAQYPNFVGVKESRVRSRIQSFVNDNWANYRAGGSTGQTSGGFNSAWRSSGAGSTMISAYKSYVSSLGGGGIISGPARPTYRAAFSRIMGDIRAKWSGNWNMRTKKLVTKRVNVYLRRQGLRPRAQTRRNPPRNPN